MLTSNPNKVRIHSQKIAPGLGTHKKSCPDLKHLTRLEMSSPDLNAVRVQRLTPARSVNANPNVVRVPLCLCGENLLAVRLCGEVALTRVRG